MLILWTRVSIMRNVVLNLLPRSPCPVVGAATRWRPAGRCRWTAGSCVSSVIFWKVPTALPTPNCPRAWTSAWPTRRL